MSKPNIVFIMSDDHGYWGLNCAGTKELRTPNLDKLAKQGIRFDNFFCASPVCSPARASIFTGTIPSQHGVHDWISGGHVDEEEIGEEIKKYMDVPNEEVPDKYKWPVGQLKGEKKAAAFIEGHKTFTEILADNGYICALSGKWHLGDSAKPQAGFSYWNTTAFGGGDYYRQPVIKAGKVEIETEKYVTDYITDNAIDFLDNHNNDKPFYLSVHYTAPHAPWGPEHHPKDIWDSYNDCEFESIPNLPTYPGATFVPGDKRRECQQGYFTAITAMDDCIGRIIDKLEDMNIMEDTLIIFTSDNGMNMGHHGIFGKGNGTFPQNMYDTSVKVPMIMYKRGTVEKGEVNTNLLSHYDIMPTLLEYVGLNDSIDEALPGNSFAQILEGDQIEGRDDVVIMDEYGPVRMIRTREWKYIHRYPYGPHELYDMINDKDEYNNLIEDESKSDIIDDMRNRLEKWFVKYVNPTLDGRHLAVTGLGQQTIVEDGKNVFRGIKTPKY